VRITIATSPAEIDALRPAWERLYEPEHYTIFQTFELNRMAAEHFGDRETPYVVLAESDSSIALIPAAARNHSGEMTLLGETLFDYRDVLHAGSHEALSAAWNEIAKLQRPFACFALRPEARKRWGHIPTHDFANAPRVGHDEMDCDEFRAQHNKLGMYCRRLIKRGVHFHARAGCNRRLLRMIYENKAYQFANEPNNIFLDPRRREFMVAACEALGDACEVFTLESDTHLVAGLVTFRDETARLFYTIYFDPAWAKFSPGTVLIYEATARTLGEGLDCDYMTGEYGYKNRLATSMVPLVRVEASAEELAQAAARPRAAA
jgi:CelD/BcsL family acetyltransferase involved in cellulose biosynthesis